MACDATGVDVATLATPAPEPSEIPAIAQRHAEQLGRLSCAGCPDSWTPAPCDVLDKLQREAPIAETVKCSIVATPYRDPAIPQGLPARTRQRIEEEARALGQARKDKADRALQLYALGADLQRLGTLELWALGLDTRTEALAVLASLPPDRAWPRALMDLEASAPAPARVADAGVLQAILQEHEMGWQKRQLVARASDQARAAIRLPFDKQEQAIRDVRQSLAGLWNEERAPVDLLEAWKASSLVRDRTHQLALQAVLSGQKSCPASLSDLVPAAIAFVPEGWTLDKDRCRPVTPRPIGQELAIGGEMPSPITDGALAAPAR